MSAFVLSAQAQQDLQLIWNHIAAENVDAADRVKDEFRSAMRQLAQMPGMGHRRLDVKNPRYRFWSVYSYLIAYFPDTQPLEVVRVIHGARDIRNIFDR